MMIRLTSVILIISMLCGCASTIPQSVSQSLDDWIGKSKTQLEAEWGRPTNVKVREDHKELWEYRVVTVTRPEQYEPGRYRFLIDTQGEIETWYFAEDHDLRYILLSFGAVMLGGIFGMIRGDKD